MGGACANGHSFHPTRQGICKLRPLRERDGGASQLTRRGTTRKDTGRKAERTAPTQSSPSFSLSTSNFGQDTATLQVLSILYV